MALVPQDGSEFRTCDISVPNHDAIDIVLEHVAEVLGNTVDLVSLVSNVHIHNRAGRGTSCVRRLIATCWSRIRL